MTYATRKEEDGRDERFEDLNQWKTRLTNQVGTWMANATNLHTDTANATEKAEIIALRDAFIADISAQMGI